MKQIITFCTVLGLVFLVEWAHSPKAHVKVPTTRYTGYDINHAAIERAKQFTVLISNEGFGGVDRGTGILVDARHVLTCAHMIDGAPEDMWIFPYPGNTVVHGKPVAVDNTHDLALVELNHSVLVSTYAVFRESHYDGEPITIIGNTMGCMKWFTSFGIVSGEWEGFILTDGMLYGGNSGGPWINERGEVVALTDWTLTDRGEKTGIHGGVAAKTINAFLKESQSPSLGQILQMLMGGK